MSPQIVVGNWKMNLGPTAAATFASQLREKCRPTEKAQAWIAPPFVSLYTVAQQLSGSYLRIGAQNVHWAESGAFTGEISPAFLKELSCTFAIVGHSERRHGLGETCELVAKRTRGAVDAGLTAIVCVGETKHERDHARTEQILSEQLEPVCVLMNGSSLEKIVLAYEPVWAIGTGVVATLEEITRSHSFIREYIRSETSQKCPPILYGGSVTPANFKEIIDLDTVDGALVGGASLKVDLFSELVAIASS